MNIRVIDAKYKGDINEERVVIKVLVDTNAYYYVIFYATLAPDKQAIMLPPIDMIWLPNAPVKKDDLIIVYSKKGTYSTKINEDNSTSHFFYLNNDKPMLVSNMDCVVVGELDYWETIPRPENVDKTSS